MAAAPLLMDVDTGVDDAMALALASRLEHHDLVAVTTVAGNVPVDLATYNTRRVLSWMDTPVPVYRGMSRPLSRKLWTATEFHGDDGLGGWEAPQPDVQESDTSAPEAIVQLARQHAGELRCAFVGPLTNLAVAVSLEPRLPEMIERLMIMGGAFRRAGNVTDSAEFNIFVDPEAAAIVAAAHFNATWVGLDVTQQTLLTRGDWHDLEDHENTRSVLVREVCRHGIERSQRPSVTLHDPLAIACLEDPEMADFDTGLVTIDLSDERRGATRLAQPTDSEPSQRVAVNVDVERFERTFARVTSTG